MSGTERTDTLCGLHARESAHWAASVQVVAASLGLEREAVRSRLAGISPGGRAIEIVQDQLRLIRKACMAGRGCGAADKEVEGDQS